jgi:hypothetical protein
MRQKLIVELLTNRSNINGTTQVRLLFFYDISAQANIICNVLYNSGFQSMLTDVNSTASGNKRITKRSTQH